MKTRRIAAVLATGIWTAAAVVADVPTYSTFELEARANITDGFNLPANSSFNSKTPAINDTATLTFSLTYVAAGDAGLFVGSGGVGSVVYMAPTDRLLEDPSINAAGAVAFSQSDFFSEGIFVYDPDDQQTTLVVPPTTFSIAGAANITNGGAIGYRANPFGGAQSWRVFESGVETFYASETGGIAFLFTPSTNDLERIAGKVRRGSLDGSSPDEIRVYSGPGSFTLIAQDVNADPNSQYAGFDNAVDLTNDGRVAFVADLVNGNRGVFLSDGTTTITIATETTPGVTDISFFRPVANDQGLVAFRGLDGLGLDAVFVGDGTTLRRVIGEHDLVPTDLGTGRIDQHDTSVTFGGSPAINARGDIAFHAALTPPNNDQIEWGSGMFIAYADGSVLPPPVPDGDTVPGSPMTVGRVGAGPDLVVSWDVATCIADDYNLLFGDLAVVSSVTITGAACSLGTSGSATFSPPAGDLFFVVASENSEGVEGGHGVDGDGDPRPSSGVGLCGVSAQSLAGSCP